MPLPRATRISLVVLCSALVGTAASAWLGGATAWAGPGTSYKKSNELDPKALDTVKGPSPKLQFYVVRVETIGLGVPVVGNPTPAWTTAHCRDVDDVPVSGTCDGMGNMVVGSRHVDWNVDDRKAGFECTFERHDFSTGGVKAAAEIVCQTF